jgi:hypothetical protein
VPLRPESGWVVRTPPSHPLPLLISAPLCRLPSLSQQPSGGSGSGGDDNIVKKVLVGVSNCNNENRFLRLSTAFPSVPRSPSPPLSSSFPLQAAVAVLGYVALTSSGSSKPEKKVEVKKAKKVEDVGDTKGLESFLFLLDKVGLPSVESKLATKPKAK